MRLRSFGIPAAALVLAAAAALYVSRAPHSPLPADASRADARTSGHAAPDVVASAPAPGSVTGRLQLPAPAAQVVPPARPRISRGAASAARDAYEHARNLGSVYNALRAQADPDAVFFAERALRDCAQLLGSGSTPGDIVPVDRYRPLAGTDPLGARRQSAYGALQSRCSGFDLDGDVGSTLSALRGTLVAANDPRTALGELAQGVRRGGDPAAVMSKARELTAGGDPYLLEEAAGVMGAMRGRYVFMFDGQLVRPDVVAAAWTMAACDAGRACGSEAVQAPCAFLGECDAPDFETSLARYQLTPMEFERMQLVRARIAQGVASGQWDAALFSPQPQPPWYRRQGP